MNCLFSASYQFGYLLLHTRWVAKQIEFMVHMPSPLHMVALSNLLSHSSAETVSGLDTTRGTFSSPIGVDAVCISHMQPVGGHCRTASGVKSCPK